MAKPHSSSSPSPRTAYPVSLGRLPPGDVFSCSVPTSPCAATNTCGSQGLRERSRPCSLSSDELKAAGTVKAGLSEAPWLPPAHKAALPQGLSGCLGECHASKWAWKCLWEEDQHLTVPSVPEQRLDIELFILSA